MKFVVRNHNSGFFANFNTVIGALAYADSLGLRCEVDWRQNWESTDFSYGTEGTNLWPALFDTLAFTDDPEQESVEFPAPLSAWNHRRMYDAQHRRELHRSYARHVRVKQHIRDRVKAFETRYLLDRPTIGLHIRHPHLHLEQYGRQMPDLDAFRAIIERDRDVCNILVASDVQSVCDVLRDQYGRAIVFQEDVARAPTGCARQVHRNNSQAGARLAEEVLSDCLLLSRCRRVHGGYSNVTGAACFMNPDAEFVLMSRHGDSASASGRRTTPNRRPLASLPRLWLIFGSPASSIQRHVHDTAARLAGHLSAGDVCVFHGIADGEAAFRWFAQVQCPARSERDGRVDTPGESATIQDAVVFGPLASIFISDEEMRNHLRTYSGSIAPSSSAGDQQVAPETVATIVDQYGSLEIWLRRCRRAAVPPGE